MDNLVKRLRAEAKAFTNHEKLLTPIQEEAADRIEQLEREKASWKGAYDGAVLALTERNKQLEAALKFYECGCKQDSCTPEEPKFRSIKCGWIAKAALGEKKND